MVSSWLTSARLRAFGSILPLFGRSTVEKGLCAICLLMVRKVKKLLSVEIRLALLRLDTLRFFENARNPWIVSSVMLLREFMECWSMKA
jgi:hypothetical protein